MAKKLTSLLSIAASDPTGGAGIQADIRAGSLVGMHVLTAVTALTVQNSKGVTVISPSPSTLLQKQLESLSFDVAPDAVKIGMVGDLSNIKVIAEFLKTLPEGTPIVADPILFSTAGNHKMTDDKTELNDLIQAYIDYIFPLATVITPNRKELALLSANNNIEDNLLLQRLNARAIIIKGGDSDSHRIEDILVQKDKVSACSHERINCQNLHGTGCVFSSLLASYMALGNSIEEAFRLTSDKMHEIIKLSCHYQLGISEYGPLNLLSYKIPERN